MPTDISEFLKISQCSSGIGKFPYVCCNPYDSFRPTASNGLGNKLPNTDECGHFSVHSRIYSGNNTDIDEFSWMALLEYRSATGVKSIRCAGFLINNRYILTAAHCITNEVEEKFGKLYVF